MRVTIQERFVGITDANCADSPRCCNLPTDSEVLCALVLTMMIKRDDAMAKHDDLRRR